MPPGIQKDSGLREKRDPKRNNVNPGAETIFSGSRDDPITENSLRSEDISSKVEYYMKMLLSLKQSIGDMKRRSVIRYDHLNRMNFLTHTSIIATSSFSAYIQTVFPESEREQWLSMLILGITSYSGLILALMKFYKLEEKKENAHNLRDRLADLEGKTCHIIDTITPWDSREHYCEQHNGTKGKDKVTEWTALIEKVDGEYLTIIEQKKELFSSYDKLFDSLEAVQGVERKLVKSQSLRNRFRCFIPIINNRPHDEEKNIKEPKVPIQL